MALINCYECDREISSKAAVCPHCGAPKEEITDIVDNQSTLIKTPTKIQKKTDKERIAGWLSEKQKTDSTQPSEAKVNKSVLESHTLINSDSFLNTPREQLTKLRNERFVTESLEKETKVSILSAVGMFLFIGSIPSVSLGGNPIMTLFALFFAIVGFRCWLQRRTFKRIIEKKSLENYFVSIYLTSLWSYLWRSLLTLTGVAVIIEFLAGGSWKGGYGSLSGVIFAYWIMGSIFIIDIPFWVKRKIIKLTE